MIVCLCKGVSCRRIREIVREGGTSVAGVAKACGAGTSCGSCVRQICAIVAHEVHELEEAKQRLAACEPPESSEPAGTSASHHDSAASITT